MSVEAIMRDVIRDSMIIRTIMFLTSEWRLSPRAFMLPRLYVLK